MVDLGRGARISPRLVQMGDLELQPDGTIRVDDVPPGQYRLDLTLRMDAPRNVPPANRVAFATRQFVVPPLDEGQAAQPLSLGVLRPRARANLKPGQAAPLFHVETLDGKRVKLEDFRGKYVLLNFWATWRQLSIADMHELKAIHERYGKNERFAMISLSLDADKEAPRKFVDANQLAWPQGFIGDWAEGGPQDSYFAYVIPAEFLIDPEGKIVAEFSNSKIADASIAKILKP